LNVNSFIARRYLFAKGTDSIKAVNYITAIASVGVAMTTAALFVILSAFAGLRSFNLSLIDKTDPDLRIVPASGKFFEYNDSIRRIIYQTEDIRVAAPVLEEKALLRAGGKQTIVLVRGVDSTYTGILNPDEILLTGQWLSEGYPYMVAGQMLADKLSLYVNNVENPVYVVIPAKSSGTFFKENLITRPFVISGVYQLTPDVEKKYVYVPADQWRQILQTGPQMVSFLDLTVQEPENIKSVKEKLNRALPSYLKIKDKLELNEALLKMLNLENAFTYLMGLLFLIIAVFNIVGSIIILILKKKKDRFVLSALGMDISDIRKIFFHYGTLLILLSGGIGLVLGTLLVYLQKHFGWINVPGTYLVYPVEFKLINYLIVAGSLILIALISSYLASRAVKEIKEKV